MQASKIVALVESTLESALDSGRTLQSIADQSEIDISQLSRFRRGERGLSLESTARLMEALGLAVVQEKRGKR
jgi:transcriptional regulator with XRE-family HTH domain